MPTRAEKYRDQRHQYYLDHKEELRASTRKRRKGAQVNATVGISCMEMLKEMAEEDGISVAEEIRRMIQREHFTRILARGR